MSMARHFHAECLVWHGQREPSRECQQHNFMIGMLLRLGMEMDGENGAAMGQTECYFLVNYLLI